MSSLSKQITQLLLKLLLLQIFFALGAAVVINYRVIQRENQELFHRVSHLEPLIYEELVLQSQLSQRKAVDFLIYDIINRKKLKYAAWMNPQEAQAYIDSKSWVKNCNLVNQTRCTTQNNDLHVGFVRIEDGEDFYGYLVQEVLVPQRLGSNNWQFFALIVIALILAFALNMLGVIVAFRRKITNQFAKLLDFIRHQESAENTQATPKTTFEIEELNAIQDKFIESMAALKVAEEDKLKLYGEAEKAKIASQVAHDIRSPLAALDVISSSVEALPEEKRVILQAATKRIRDIANNLVQKNRVLPPNADETSIELLSSLVESLLSEKRLQIRNRPGISLEANISQDNYGLFAKLNAVDFKRVLSNLINNSIEAIAETGEVKIDIRNLTQEIEILVIDSGVGIAPEILPQLMQQGASFGKESIGDSGTGLGLYHAKEIIESFGGRISISSKLNKGTTVTVTIPKQAPPNWFIPKIKVFKGSQVAILDDDESIHQVWEARFRSFSKEEIKLHHFYSGIDLIKVVKAGKSFDRYLVDFELIGFNKSGLDIVEELHISKKSILVPAHFENPQLRERCVDNGVKMVPKGLANWVPISLVEQKVSLDAILLDDDPLVHQMWKLSAAQLNKNIKTFTHPAALLEQIDEIEKNTPIYVDVNLSDGQLGTTITHDLFNRGYCELYLATGDRANKFADIDWIKGVVGKEVPAFLNPNAP